VHVSDIGLTSAEDLVVLVRARDEDRVLVSCDHDFVQMLFASGDTRPSLILICEIETLNSAEIASLLVQALATELTDLLPAGAIATLTPDRVRATAATSGRQPGNLDFLQSKLGAAPNQDNKLLSRIFCARDRSTHS
jgi:predicted nuclease of predicted toxin-antitoxin system